MAQAFARGINLIATTTPGAPTAGTWGLGDTVQDSTGAWWTCSAAGTPGTWTAVGSGGGGGTVTGVFYDETPAGTVNGSNVTFTLTATPSANSLQLFRNGVRQVLTTDYTLSGSTVTFVTAPATGSTLRASYAGSGASVTVAWGNITGQIDNQTDLKLALMLNALIFG